MKTKRDFISEITTNEANFKYCAEKGVINGVLLVDIETAMQKYTDQQLILHDVSQQRELLLAYEEHTSLKVLGKKTPRISKQMVEDYLANNCG